MATRTTTKKAEPKTTTANTAIKKEAPAKISAEPVKTEAPAADAPKKTTEKAPAKKAATTKKAAEKTTAKKTTAKKTTEKKPTARKTTAKKAAVNTEVYVQFLGKEVYAKDVVEGVKKIWTDEMGKKESELKELKVYIKPEDNGAYYVINGDITGFFGL